MKARVKATGEIIELKGGDVIYQDAMQDLLEEIELIEENPDYWEKLKHQYAGMAMQGILSNQDYCRLLIEEDIKGSFADDVSRCAKDFATALVKKLKEE